MRFRRPIVYAIVLFALNAFIARKLFVTAFTGHMNSNEGSFIAISQFILDEWPHIGWFPRWFAGIPFENTYSPLLQLADAGVAKFVHWSPALAFHATVAFFYSIGPALLFVFAFQATRLAGSSFLAALVYSLYSPSTLIPEVRIDAGGWQHARRLHTLVHYGEGPHNIVLALFPLALLFAYLALTRRKTIYYLATGLMMAIVVLFNAFGATELALGMACLILALAPRAGWLPALRLAAVAVLAYLWISPALPPQLIQTLRTASWTIDGDFRYTARTRLALMLILAGQIALFFAVRNLKHWFDRFVLLFAFPFTAMPLLGFMLGIALLPQPRRYHLEMEMAACLVCVFMTRHLYSRAPSMLRISMMFAVAAFLVWQFISYAGFSGQLIQPIEITTTIEYKVAKWMDSHLQGQRAMLGGDAGLWYNVFTANPQLGSGHDPFSPNWMIQVAVYTIHSGENAGTQDAHASITWLKAYGCHAVVVPGPESHSAYKPFRNPAKFDGILPVLWRDEGTTIYGIPGRTTSLAHVIPNEAAVSQPPIHGLDLDGVSRFVAALENPSLPLVELQWLSPANGHISALAEPGQAISVQVTYDPGWTASANGQAVPIQKDGIGLMVLHPACNGTCEIDLHFGLGGERVLCWILSALVTLGIFVYFSVSGTWERWMCRPAAR